MGEHMKKMMLVDAANFASDLRNVKRHYGVLDQNISDVLNREDIDEREKLKLYQVALSKFLVNRQAVESALGEPVKVEPTKSPLDLDKLGSIIADAIKSVYPKRTDVAPTAPVDLLLDLEEEEKEQPQKQQKVFKPPTKREESKSPPRRRRSTRKSKPVWIRQT